MANTINILKPSVCFEVQKVIGISTRAGNCKTYQVQWAPTWISGVHLVGCEDLIEQFEDELKEKEPVIKIEEIESLDLGERGEVIQSVSILPNDDSCKEQFIEIPHSSLLVNSNLHTELSLQPNNSDDVIVKLVSLNMGIQNNIQDDTEQHIGKNTIRPRFKCLETNLPKLSSNTSRGKSKVLPLSDVAISEYNYDADCQDANANATDCGYTDVHVNEAWRNTSSNETPQNNNGNTKANNETVSELKKIFACNVCNKIFSCARNLKCHSKIHTNIYQCVACYRNFTTKRNLRRHELIHSDGRRFPCNICKKIFRDNLKLHVHLQTHTAEVCRYQCTYCTKVFPTSTKLTMHIRIHTGERPFGCNECGKRFRQKQHLQVHHNKQHSHLL